jgi:hypothetical protein
LLTWGYLHDALRTKVERSAQLRGCLSERSGELDLEALVSMEGTTMCWTRTDHRVEDMQTKKFATKKDEGEAFRTLAR